MRKIEILKVEVEIVKSKLLVFLAVSGGSWVYALKVDVTLFKIVLLLSFSIAGYGVVINMLKLTDLHNKLKDYNEY